MGACHSISSDGRWDAGVRLSLYMGRGFNVKDGICDVCGQPNNEHTYLVCPKLASEADETIKRNDAQQVSGCAHNGLAKKPNNSGDYYCISCSQTFNMMITLRVERTGNGTQEQQREL